MLLDASQALADGRAIFTAVIPPVDSDALNFQRIEQVIASLVRATDDLIAHTNRVAHETKP
jgi:hypothetical protein